MLTDCLLVHIALAYLIHLHRFKHLKGRFDRCILKHRLSSQSSIRSCPMPDSDNRVAFTI